MKIRIETTEKSLNISVPNALLSPKLIPWVAEKIGKRTAPEALDRIPPGILEALFRELRGIKQKHGSWELADIQSANGDRIHLIL